jgi:HPt (histidine-containing phosphotransfer) domain-containing protein
LPIGLGEKAAAPGTGPDATRASWRDRIAPVFHRLFDLLFTRAVASWPRTGSFMQAMDQNGTPNAIDRAHLERATFGDRGLARQVLKLFESRCQLLLQDIVHAPDVSARIYAAHTLKGAARGVGATQVAEAAAAFEPPPEDPAQVAAALALLVMRIDEARAASAAIIERD